MSDNGTLGLPEPQPMPVSIPVQLFGRLPFYHALGAEDTVIVGRQDRAALTAP